MTVLEDIARYIASRIVSPALAKAIKGLHAAFLPLILLASSRITRLLTWVASSRVSIWTWVRNEITTAIDLFVDGYAKVVGNLKSKVEEVTKQVEGILEHVRLFASRVITVTIRWWADERVRMLKVMRDTYVRILEFEKEAIKVILDWWTDTWTIVVNHVKAGVEELGLKLDIDIDDVLKQLKSTRDTVLTRITEQIDVAVRSIDVQIEKVIARFEEMNRVAKSWMEAEIEKVINLYREEVPNIVEALFMWAKPIVEPILEGGTDLRFIVDALRERVPTDPEWKRVMEENAAILDDVKKKLEGF